jgi:acyl carrier protein
MSKITQSEVIAVIENALEVKAGMISESTRAEEVDGWDSLGQLSILVALDKLFVGKIASITTMAEADSMPKILDILKQHSLL